MPRDKRERVDLLGQERGGPWSSTTMLVRVGLNIRVGVNIRNVRVGISFPGLPNNHRRHCRREIGRTFAGFTLAIGVGELLRPRVNGVHLSVLVGNVHQGWVEMEPHGRLGFGRDHVPPHRVHVPMKVAKQFGKGHTPANILLERSFVIRGLPDPIKLEIIVGELE